MNIKTYRDLAVLVSKYIYNEINLNRQRDKFLEEVLTQDLSYIPGIKKDLSLTSDRLLNSVSIYYDSVFVNQQKSLYPNNYFIDPRGINQVVYDMSLDAYNFNNILSLLNDGNIKYSGIKFIDSYIGLIENNKYIDLDFLPNQVLDNTLVDRGEPKLLWEFAESSNNFEVFLKPYYYTSVDINKLSILFPFLPRRTKWYTVDNVVSLEYSFPLTYNLIPVYGNNFVNTITILTKDLGNNLLPNFLFTGKVYLLGERGLPYYEYSNVNSIYSFPGDLYISPLKPDLLDFPLGLPKKDELEECLIDKISYYPNRGDIDTELGQYTGYITNSKYHKNITYYLYRRSDDSLFLSLQEPLEGVKEQVLDKRIELYLPEDPYISQDEDIDINITITSSNSPSQYNVLIKEII